MSRSAFHPLTAPLSSSRELLTVLTECRVVRQRIDLQRPTAANKVVGILVGVSIVVLVTSPLLLLASPCILCCVCKPCTRKEKEKKKKRKKEDSSQPDPSAS